MIKEVVYQDVDGNELFSEPMIFKRLWAIGDELIEDYQRYMVVDREVKGELQLVTIKRQEAKGCQLAEIKLLIF